MHHTEICLSRQLDDEPEEKGIESAAWQIHEE